MDRHEEDDSRFLQFCENALKNTEQLMENNLCLFSDPQTHKYTAWAERRIFGMLTLVLLTGTGNKHRPRVYRS